MSDKPVSHEYYTIDNSLKIELILTSIVSYKIFSALFRQKIIWLTHYPVYRGKEMET
jgi:hypothetical protein